MPYEEYFKSATEGLIIVDGAGRIVEVNRAAEQLFGYSKEELSGQQVEVLVPAHLREFHLKHVQDYFAAPRTRAMGRGLSLAARRKDGSEFPVEISLTYARGTRRGDLVVAAVIDIGQRLAFEDEVRRADSLLSLETVAAGIAHDLNNPLQVIRSRSELILELKSGSPTSEIKEDVATIHRQAQRASRIVDQFLELSRRNGTIVSPVDLNDIVDGVLLLVGDAMRERGIRVEKNLDRTLPCISGHRVALERVVTNLLTNAYDVMPEGGTVKIKDGLRPETGWLYLTVSDSGSGIAPEIRGRIFDLLYTTKPNGCGLGLWLSQRIIHEHNGRIEVHSEPGKGATFTILLPVGSLAGG
jgi:PAS domain S-box-containing protein